MELEVGNLKSRLVTDNPKVLNAFWDKYGYFVDGYKYVPSYRSHKWDGKKRYFTKNGQFRSGLLPRIIKDLEAIGCSNPKIKYDLPPIPADKKLLPVETYEYRDYQEEAILECISRKRLIVESPVGSGKTLIMAGLVKSLGEKTVILFGEKGILNQTYEFFKSCGIKSLGVNSGEGYIYGDVMLSTVQSIDKILDTHLMQAKALIVDEVHQFCKGDMRIAAIEAFPNAVYRVGFTATVQSEKSDVHGRLTLEGAFGEVYSTRSISDLIADGKLAKPIIQIVEYSPKIIDESLSYIDQYSQHIINSKERNDMIVSIAKSIQNNIPGSKTLILVKNLEHLEELKGSIPNCVSVEGKDSLDDRYSIIKKFIKSKDPICLIGTNVMQTGISINEITHMINARGLKGEIPTVQGLGRGIRKSDTKTQMYFYDFFDKVPYLDSHSESRIEHYTNLKFEINYVRIT